MAAIKHSRFSSLGKQRYRLSSRDWKPSWNYYTQSQELAFMACILGRQKIAASSLKGNPERLRVNTHHPMGESARYSLIWISRRPHPQSGSHNSITLLVDWETLELVE